MDLASKIYLSPVATAVVRSWPVIMLLLCVVVFVCFVLLFVPGYIFISYLTYLLHYCTLPDKRCLSYSGVPLSGRDDVALFE